MPPIVIIAGPTASGKSALALGLAKSFGGTIINADALQVYRDLPILTASPGPEARALVPHRLYGCLDGVRARLGRAVARSGAGGNRRFASHPAGCHSWSAGLGCICVRCAMGLPRSRRLSPAFRAEAAVLYAELGGEGFRAHLAALDPEAASLCPPETGSG